MTPGPAPVHPAARQAAVGPLPHHRAPAFKPRFAAVQAGLRAAFRTESPVAILACSGTGAVEAALLNLFAPGDPVVVVAAGKFGQRWTEIARTYGCEAHEIALAPGEPAVADDIAAVAAETAAVGLVLTASETSTASVVDVEAIMRAVRGVRPDIRVVVDAITAVGAMPIETDAWGIDAVCGGSQKAFMIPPGLGFVACSGRGWERIAEERSTPRYYFDLRRYAAAAERDQTPFTPATGLLLELEGALSALEDQGGIGALEANAQRLAAATRAAAAALGLSLLSPDNPSDAVTAIRAHRSGEAPTIVATLRDRHGVQVAGGQGELKPDIFRIGHLGYIDGIDLLGTLAALESVLAGLGHEVASGASVAAATAVLDAGA